MSNFLSIIIENKIIYLLIGFILSIFSIGGYNISITIYIWPFCFLAYLHNHNTKLLPLIIVSICIVISNIFRWISISHESILEGIIIGLYFSLINIIPFIIDDIFYDKISKWKNIFLFPLSVAFCEFLFSFSFIANHNIYAYALRDNNQMLQICSLFGCYFLSFIIALFSSILVYSHSLYLNQQTISKFIVFYVILISLIYFFGCIRLVLHEEKGTYNIGASIGISNAIYEHEKSDEHSVRELDEYVQYINNTIRKAKAADCKIMTYAEEAFAIYLKNKTEIIDRVSKLAEENQIFVLLPLDIAQDDEGEDNTNEAILISDKGKPIYYYIKQHLVPYLEIDYSTPSDEVKVVNTTLGKMTVVICYDINFPYFINNLSREHFDILLIPSWDWDGIAEFHSFELRYRTIENGFNAIKNTANGNTISIDYKGRILSYFISKECEDYFLVNTINIKGVTTLYSYIGIYFNYLYLLVIICILISGIISEKFCSQKSRDVSISRFNELNEDMNNNDEDN